MHKLLVDQIAAYRQQDKPTKQQKAIPISVLRKLHSTSISALSQAVCQLCIGALFFAMRSCEYTRDHFNDKSRKTKLLRLRNIRFFRGNLLLAHASPILHKADTVVITFESQKNDDYNESVVMKESGDPIICPVASWQAIVRRIYSYPGSSPDSYVNSFFDNGKLQAITASQIIMHLRTAAALIGKSVLGFDSSEIGTHSLRSGAAMAMYLGRVPVFTIMLTGRWRSTAFLVYIRKQVESFAQQVSSSMLTCESFFTVPSVDPSSNNLDMGSAVPARLIVASEVQL